MTPSNEAGFLLKPQAAATDREIQQAPTKMDLKDFAVGRIQDIEKIMASQLRNIYRSIRRVGRRITDENQRQDWNLTA